MPLLALTGWSAVAAATLALSLAAACGGANAARPQSPALRWSRILVGLAWLLTTLSLALLAWALVTDRFELAYVARNGQRTLPLAYKVAAVWSGQAGSLLLWFWLAVTWAAAVAWAPPRGLEEVWSRALALLCAQAAFFGFLVTAVEPPFAVQLPPPPEGRGMNPLLRHPSMLVHPLLLYSGFTAFSVPFAVVWGAWLARRTDDAWFPWLRRWMLSAWLLLSMGILAGAHWAYEVLGWGGYWGWDPVENASLLPWLTSTAFLHSALVQEQRGMMRRWNSVLVMATYLLAVLGTLLTRSGILVSVHAFAQSDIGPWLVAYLSLLLALSAYLLADRWHLWPDRGEMESLLSREAGFLLNNWVLVGSAFTVLWGILFPILARLMGFSVALGAPYYERVQGPLFGLLLVLMGVGPFLAWRRTHGPALGTRLAVPAMAGAHAAVTAALVADLRWGAVAGMAASGFTLVASLWALVSGPARQWVRTRSPAALRQAGGYLVHLGIALMAVGIVGSQFYALDRQVVLTLGERVRVGPYLLEYSGLTVSAEPGYRVAAADIRVWTGKGSTPDWVMRPQKLDFPTGPVARVAVAGSLLRDLYLALGGWEEDGARVALHVRVNPLVAWIWIGGYVLLAGALLALWPREAGRARREEPSALSHRVRRGAFLALLLAAAGSAAAPAPVEAAPAVEREVWVLQVKPTGAELLVVATLRLEGEAPASPVELPIPEGAVAVAPQGGFTPGKVQVEGWRLQDRGGLRPGQKKTYTYLVRLPAQAPPFLVQRQVVYPTEAITVLLDARLKLAGAAWEERGWQDVGGVTLRAYQATGLPPGAVRRLAVQEADPAAGLPVVVQQERMRGWALPGLVAVLTLAAGGIRSWWREARAAKEETRDAA